MFFIKEYTVNEAMEILKNLDSNSIEEDMFRNTKHVNYSNNKRHEDPNEIYNLLINHENEGILKSNYNTFKIFYSHPRKKSKDLCIVIAINDNRGIKLITTFNQPKERRVRTYEQ